MRVIVLAFLALLAAAPAMAGWGVATSPHFRVIGEEPPARLRETARLLEDFRALVAASAGLRPADGAPRDPAETAALLALWYPLSGAQIACAQRNAVAEAGDGFTALLAAIAREFHKAGRAFPGLPS